MMTLMVMPEMTTVDPTDRSMPPEAMTAVMPSAMMPTKAKLRVTLNRLRSVAKVSVRSDSATQASTAATNTQKVCWPVMRDRMVRCSDRSMMSARLVMDISCNPYRLRRFRWRR